MKIKKTDNSIDIPKDAEYCVVVHYSEIGLKGKNRSMFENRLRHNIVGVLSETTFGSVQRYFGRILIRFPENFVWEGVKNKLEKIFGIAHFSLAILINQQLENITKTAIFLLSTQVFNSFRVRTQRSQKDYPLTSGQINAHVGSAIQKKIKAKVDLTSPEVVCYIEVFNKYALVYSEKNPGLGGLPSGANDRVVALLSTGIDSPVAAWKIMKRGVHIIFVHFHSIPLTSKASYENAKRIVQVLTRYQFRSKLYLVPFIKIQEEIRVEIPEEYRVLMYRRSMFRLAQIIAGYEKADGLVTGENVGQVASQTIRNIRAIGEAVKLPVLRPLAGNDKIEISLLAQQIGTYTISIEPYEDCCSLFVPKHPALRASAKKLKYFEKHLNLEAIQNDVLNGIEIVHFTYPDK